MKPGEAKLQKRDGGLTLTICDDPGSVPMGAADIAGHGILHQVGMANGVNVAVVELVLRIVSGDSQRTYRAFVNELEQGIMAALAIAIDIKVILVTPKGREFATSPLVNPFTVTANEVLEVIAGDCAVPWNGAQFAIAVKYVVAGQN